MQCIPRSCVRAFISPGCPLAREEDMACAIVGSRTTLSVVLPTGTGLRPFRPPGTSMPTNYPPRVEGVTCLGTYQVTKGHGDA